MLAPHAVDIAVITSSLIASLCFTFAEPFDNIFLFVESSCALVSRNTKIYDPRKDFCMYMYHLFVFSCLISYICMYMLQIQNEIHVEMKFLCLLTLIKLLFMDPE